MPTNTNGTYARIYQCIAKIPHGKVATYGQVAKLISASGPRQIGYALSSIPPGVDIPWHRVINAKGEISPRSGSEQLGDHEQYSRLVAEGIVVNKNSKINLSQHQWQPTFDDLLLEDSDEEDDWENQPGFG